MVFRASATTTGTAGANDYFDIAEVQMEVSSTATDFEQRSYGEELALCQRYYEICGHMEGFAFQSDILYGRYTFKVTKREIPTLIKLTTNIYGETAFDHGATASNPTVVVHSQHESSIGVKVPGFSGYDDAGRYYIWLAADQFAADAELA
jgi:hypothetical protein